MFPYYYPMHKTLFRRRDYKVMLVFSLFDRKTLFHNNGNSKSFSLYFDVFCLYDNYIIMLYHMIVYFWQRATTFLFTLDIFGPTRHTGHVTQSY